MKASPQPMGLKALRSLVLVLDEPMSKERWEEARALAGAAEGLLLQAHQERMKADAGVPISDGLSIFKDWVIG
jgi:hypothetical protein